MVHVIASIHFDPARENELLTIYSDFVPEVLSEEGCIEYTPTRDLETDLPNQEKNEALFTVTEKWISMDAFKAHLNAPHVLEFRKKIQGIVTKVSVKVLQDI